jgi:hypothetical protein
MLSQMAVVVVVDQRTTNDNVGRRDERDGSLAVWIVRWMKTKKHSLKNKVKACCIFSVRIYASHDKIHNNNKHCITYAKHRFRVQSTNALAERAYSR